MLFYNKQNKRPGSSVFSGLLLCVCVLTGLFSPATALADATENKTPDTVTDAGATDITGTYHWPSGPQLAAEGAILIEAETGAVLYEKNATERFYPASTTKLMTALLALENAALGETVTISHNAVYDIDVDSSRIWVDVGEELSMQDSLYALMLPSANDLAYAIAEHISGTMPAFAELMNSRAAELGCVNTHFMNPHGLDEDEHYTCPADLARITRPLLKNSTFVKISGSKNYEIKPTNLCKDSRWILNTHLMLRGTQPYEGVIAGKTGHTDLAGANLVTCARRGTMTLIAVIMKAPDDTALYNDTATLLNYGFDNFTTYSVADEQLADNNDVPPLFHSEDTVQMINRDIISTDSGLVVLPFSATLSDTTKTVSLSQLTSFATGKNIIGTVTYTYGNRVIGSAHIVYDNEGPAFTIKSTEDSLPDPQAPSAQEGSSQEITADDEKTKTEDTPKKDRKALIIGIIFGCICFFIGIYFIFVELPYRKKRAAYLAKRRNGRR
ncbi:MAG: D-alanyl-D-alanine carboxypeptidase [Lachnospiraceae bacterium]|nr:D-alanyl-D-alanine carboxypeptidase [Lachnospiraceae bacterium]